MACSCFSIFSCRKCPDCNFTTWDTQAFRMHLRITHGDQLWCLYCCDFQFPAAASYLYRRHIESEHDKVFKEGLATRLLEKDQNDNLQSQVNQNIQDQPTQPSVVQSQPPKPKEGTSNITVENILEELLPPGCLSPLPLTPPRKTSPEQPTKEEPPQKKRKMKPKLAPKPKQSKASASSSLPTVQTASSACISSPPSVEINIPPKPTSAHEPPKKPKAILTKVSPIPLDPTSPPREKAIRMTRVVPAKIASVPQWPTPLPDDCQPIDARYKIGRLYHLEKIILPSSSYALKPRGRDPRVEGLILKRKF